MKSYPDTNIDDLIEGCKNGNRKSQQAVFEIYYSKLMSISLRYTHDKDDAKDILQEGFIKAFGQIEKYNFIGSFEGWLKRIVVNTAIDFYRKKSHEFNLFDTNTEIENINIVEENEELDENMFKQISSGDIINAIQKLSPAYRTVFNLYVVDGYTHQQIAEELNINIGTSKSNYAKARLNLQKIIKEKINYAKSKE